MLFEIVKFLGATSIIWMVVLGMESHRIIRWYRIKFNK